MTDAAPSPFERIRWAPKVRQEKIWQLYQNDALHLIDEELIEDVGYRLLHRCNSIRIATSRSVECPRCGAEFKLAETSPWRLIPGQQICPRPGCGWQTTPEEWHNSWHHRDLLGAAAIPAIETYLADYPRAATPQQRMVCIDQLIHAFHISLRDGQVGRSFANNLIEGSHTQVVDLLDRLFALPGGVEKDQWRADVQKMNQRRRGQA
jgi:hypothetical protein